MGKLNYLIIHCTATPSSMTVTKEMLQEWHMGPCDQPGGVVRYLGKDYASRAVLPADIINGKPIAKIKGRGWNRLGYSMIIHRNGASQILTPFNDDDVITNDEMTWGATGVNAISRHIVLEGGIEAVKLMPFSGLFAIEQRKTLITVIKQEIQKVPTIKVAGHNNFAQKTCPGFNVEAFLIENKLGLFAYKV